jgi:hypothetical protein
MARSCKPNKFMPEAANPAPAQKPAAPVAPAAPLYSPWAVHFPVGLIDDVKAEIDGFNPKNAEPGHLQLVKSAVLGMIALLPANARGCEVRMECTGSGGSQILCQVTPGLLKKA